MAIYRYEVNLMHGYVQPEASQAGVQVITLQCTMQWPHRSNLPT